MSKRKNQPQQIENPEIILVAKSLEQKQLIKTIKENTITFVDGPAGSGKTWISVLVGLQQVLDGTFDRMLVTRPVVEAAGEKLGYLPGDMFDKIDPFLFPIFDTLSQVMPEEDVRAFCRKNGESKMKILPLAYMRGVTLRKTYAILDEAQNTTPDQMRMFLTRIGEGSKIVVSGDSTQSDIKNTNGLRDALYRFVGVANTDKSIGVVKLTEASVVRHPIINLIEEIYKKK